MATRKLKSPTTGETVEAEVIEIAEISNPPTRIVLADGSTLRLKSDIIEVTRFEGEWDLEGHPRYSVKSGNLMAVLDSPDHLKKGAAKEPLQ